MSTRLSCSVVSTVFAVTLALVSLVCAASGQTRFYVNQGASGSSQNGASWPNAFTKLEDALNAAQPTLANPVEIWVAKGTYKPTSGTDRNSAFRLKSHLTIRGGFRGNEASPNDRTPWGNPTILSGDIGTPMTGAITDVNTFPSQEAVTSDAGWEDNSYNVLVGTGVENVTLEYLTVTGGSATNRSVDAADIDGYETFSDTPETPGAKSIVKPSSSVVGGGLYFTTGSGWNVNNLGVQIFGCTFARNRARGYGGAMGVYDGSALILGCTFEENVSEGSGGAFWGLNQATGFAQCTFQSNVAANGGGAAKIIGIPSARSASADVDKFNDTLRSVVFGIYGVSEPETRDRVGYILTSYGVYKAANQFAATQGGFFTRFASTIPNPFARSTTQIGGATVTNTSISPGVRVAAGYALIQIGVSAAGMIVNVLDQFGKLDKNSDDYKRWDTFNTNFNRYATPQGLVSLATHAALDAFVPGSRAEADMIGVKKKDLANYTQAGRSGFASCTFRENESGNEGGAIELIYNNLLVESCTFEKNRAWSNGGAISSAVSNMPQVVSSVFSENTCTHGASAIANNFNSLMMVINCTIINNRSSDALGKAVLAAMGADVRIYNSILWNNRDGTGSAGADVEAVMASQLNEDALKRYNALQGERINWVGIMDIRNSIVQSLATIPLGRDNLVPRLAGSNLSQAEINAVFAAMHDADARGELEGVGAVNVGEGVRPKLRDASYGNSALNPMLLASPVGRPSRQSRANNAGRDGWIIWGLVPHAVPLANITDVAGRKRILNSQVDIGAFEVDNTVPDNAPPASEEVVVATSSGPAASGVGAVSVPTIGSTTPTGTTVYYVTPTTRGNGNGLSWANATSNLQSAISHANAEVWVAAGTYKPTAGTDRSASFTLANGVKVFGGFASGETTRAARNWKTNATIISGDLGAAGVATDNSKNLFKNTGLTSATVLDGFTLRDAFSTDADGGAISNTDAAPLIQNCVFRSNHARNGGAIYSSGSNLAGSVLVNCEFRDNAAESTGGAIRYTQILLANNVTFSGNTAGTNGGAISVTGSLATHYCTIQNALFHGNSTANGTGGAIDSAGLYLNVANSTFYGNTAALSSATEKAGGGAIHDAFTAGPGLAAVVIVNSIFYKNTATNSAAGGTQTVEKQQILTAGTPLVSHCLVQGLSSYTVQPRHGNFSGDPQFVVEGTDFRLRETSLAIDAGDSTNVYIQGVATDLDGKSRRLNGAVDLGPYENNALGTNPVRLVTKASIETETFTFTAAYTPVAGDKLTWYVDRGDGLGYVPLTESAENAGVNTNSLTVSSRPNGFSYVLRVIRNGLIYFSAASTLEPTAESIAKYVYVKPVSTGDGSGSTWANATSDLKGAISRENAEVWVAAGTYKPTSGTDRDQSFSIGESTKVYGGFVGNETKTETRNWRTNKSIISGEIGGAGAEDNSRHLFQNTDIESTAVLDGFHLQHAYAGDQDGGAILNVGACPQIQNCVFESNQARNGGAIFSTDARPFGSKLFNCEFRGNTASVSGGAVSYDGSWAGSNLIFKDNIAAVGGAVHSTGDAQGQHGAVQSALFVGNRSTAGAGGAIVATDINFYVINSTLYGNEATVNSAVPAAGGGISFSRIAQSTASLSIYNSILYKNNALNGGAGGRATVEKQQVTLSAAGIGGAKSSLIQGLQTFSGTGNFDGDPLFVLEGTDFRVTSSSLTIDLGVTDEISSRIEATDLLGNSRITNGVIDLGPYESVASATNPIRKMTASSAGLESYTYTLADYSAEAGDVLQWQVDRGDGFGFVLLGANDPGDDALPDEYLGFGSASLTVLSPPSGFVFRVRLTRGNTIYFSPIARLNPTELSKKQYTYVRPVATGDGSGSGWANATSDLQAALSKQYTQVWVQQGTYYPTSSTDRNVSFSMARGVKVYGGFRGIESVCDARKITNYPTIVSGNIGSPANAQDNSRHLFRNEGIDSSALLDGFFLQEAYADGEDGGAVLNVSASPIFNRCTFRNNYARNGGALASTGTPSGSSFASKLVDCRFEDNTAQLSGGALTCNSSISITNVVFDGNQATAGGAIHIDGTGVGQSFTVRNGLFVDNRSLAGRGGAVFGRGMALTFVNSTFYKNQATLSSTSPLGGGAVYQEYTLTGASTVSAYNSIFRGNKTVNSGAGGLASLEFQQIAVIGGLGIFAHHSLIEGLNKYTNIPEFGNFDEDPKFVDALNGNFRLSDVSPAINSGAPVDGYYHTDTDLDGNARVLLGTPDVGAYEYTGSAALGRIVSSSDFTGGVLKFSKSAGFVVQAGDVLQWYVDRGDGNGFVLLAANGIYSGVNSATLSITAPPQSANGYQFRLQVTRGAATLTTLPSQLTLPLSRIYVDDARLNMAADGVSWSTAYGDLSDALAASGPGSTIWVAEGTYLPTSGADTRAAFRIPNGVTVYGGFPNGADDLGDRNPTTKPTILSGKLNGATDRFDYSRNVVVNQGAVGRTTILDGFVLEDAYTSLLLNDGASPSIRNCVFRNNDSSRAGGGEGAAVSNLNGANPLISGCQFLGNTSSYAGALYIANSSATVENSVFARNTATAIGGAIFVQRGTLNLVHCTIADNTSRGTAGALHAQDSTVTIANSILWNNRITYTGLSAYDRAIRNAGSTLTFSHSCVEGGTTLPATNLAFDPIFDPTQGGEFAVARFSPLVNAGSASHTVSSPDMAGRPRVFGAAPDMGAYELQVSATGPIRLNAVPRSRTVYNIGGSVDFTVSWPQGTTFNPAWHVMLGVTPVNASRYTIISGIGFSTLRLNNITLDDTGMKVSVTDTAQGVDSIAPAILTVKEPRIVRVKSDATGNNNGTSWTHAYTDLATALIAAQPADEIWVAAGTYVPVSASNFNLNNSVSLYGGFLGSELLRSERDYANRPTILHGTAGDPTLYTASSAADSGLFSSVDGFIIENSTSPFVVYNERVSTTYRNCTFRSNASYIGNLDSQVVYENCQFSGNTGSLFYNTESFVTFSGCSIRQNTTAADLMVCSNASTVVLNDTEVVANNVAGALIRNGSGASGGSLLTVLRSAFRGNSTGGAVIDNSTGSTCAIESSLFAGNTASADFATIHNSGTISIRVSTIADNRGGSFGGGLATYPTSTASVSSSIFWGNRGSRATASIEAQQVGSGSGTLSVKRTIIEGLATLTAAGDQNTSYYPLFADPTAGNYHLLANSPAVDTSETNLPLTSALDLDKKPRPIVYGDAGAYELVGAPGTPLMISTFPGSISTTESTATGFTIVGIFSNLQWQYHDGNGWVTITGDTSNYRLIQSPDGRTRSLYFDSPSLALNGSRYRAVVTLGGITFTSGDLVLTVNQPRVIYVNGGVAASGDGSSWATAFKTVPEALAVTNENCEIWVQAGTYSVNAAYLSWKVRMYGGFAGGETQRAQRDWASNPVTLVGGARQIFVGADRAADLKTNHAVLDGFTLTGAASSAAVELSNSNAHISNCAFRANALGIGVSGQSNPVIENCVFEAHTGMVLALDGDTATVRNCTIQNNTNSSPNASGVGIYIFRGNVEITDSAFTGNTVSGGLIYVTGDTDATSVANVVAGNVTKLSMSRCRITDNSAYAAIFASQSLLNADNSLLARNTLTTAAILGGQRCQFNLMNLTVAHNTGTHECAGIHSDGRWTLTNSIVWGNRTTWPYGPLIHPGSPSLMEDVQVKLNTWTVVKNSTVEGAHYTTLGGNPNGNSSYDPLFIDAAAGAFQLTNISPAINSGTAAGVTGDATDLASQPRTAGALPDMGAYEFTSTAGAAVRVSSNLSAMKLIVGQSLEFSVNVPVGVAVQWQVKSGGTFANVVQDAHQILSGDGKILTLNQVTLGMSGNQYRFVLSGGVSYTGSSATLTVVPKPIVYVDLTATGSGDGTNWADAYTSVSAAIFAAVNPITGGPCEIWVADGTYTFTGNTPVSPGVELYGGFAGGEATRSARNVAANPTVLTRSVPAAQVLGADVLSDSYADVRKVGIVVDGFTFTGSSSGVTGIGGPVTVRNCTFTNLAGYGVRAIYVPVAVEDCVFDQPGGIGVYAGPGSTTVVKRSTVKAGLASAGTDLYPVNFSVEDTVVRDNVGNNLAATISVGAYSTLNLTRSQVLKNHSQYAIENDGRLVVRQSLIADNFGTGVYMTYRSQATWLTSVTVAGNETNGVQIGWQNSSLRLANCVIAGNGFRQVYTDSGGVFARYTLIQDESNGGEGTQSWDPLFVDAAAGDYRLAPRSPGINAGELASVNAGETDLLGAARVQSGAPDMGAYESANPANPLYRGTPPTSLAQTRGVDAVFSLRGANSYAFAWQYFDGAAWVDITFNSATGQWEGPAGIPITISTVNGLTKLTVPGATLAANGLQFRVVINGENYVSEPLTLTVNEPQIMYVDASVAASGNGQTWGTAFKTLGEALAQVIQSRRIIYIAAGTYKPSVTGFSIAQRVEIYGGFPNGGAAFAQRDAAANPVILSGELGDPVSTADNASPVVKFTALNSPIAADTILDGVTVTRGRLGMRVWDNAKPTLRNLTVSQNAAGGLEMTSAGGRVENVDFFENTASHGAGAVVNGSTVTFSGCEFRGNTATSRGGALYLFNGSTRMENLVISGNRSEGEGGGIVVDAGSGHVLVNSTVIGNSAATDGGGLYVYIGAGISVRNSTFWANRASGGSLAEQQMDNHLFGGTYNVQSSNVEGRAPAGSNLSVEPLFFSTIQASSAPTTSGDFHIYGGSPGVDRGDNSLLDGLSVDAENLPRAVRAVDIGAFEVQTAAGDPLEIVQQPADLVFAPAGTNQYHVQLSGSGYTYQWESSTNGSIWAPVVNGAGFAGAQTATLSVLAADITMHGTLFRVQVTSPAGGAVYSRNAVLKYYPTQYFVNAAAADDSGDGTTWQTAFKTVGAALQSMAPNPAEMVQIWVAEGTYTTSPTDTAAAFPVKTKVGYFGGFAGNETQLSQRNISAHPTVFKGIAGSTAVFSTTGAAPVTDATIDGITITTATMGIALDAQATLTVANCTFTGLDVGIEAESHDLTVRSCTFEGETQAGISSVDGHLNVADSVFRSNKRGIQHVRFNRSEGNAVFSVQRSIFQKNGDLAVRGGAVTSYSAAAYFESCLFSGNIGRSGGGIRADAGLLNVRNCTFAGNHAAETGGGIDFIKPPNGRLGIYNSIFWGNTGMSGSNFYGQIEDHDSPGSILLNNDVQGAVRPGNISQDPQFAAPIASSTTGVVGGDYRVIASSPVINGGNNAERGNSATDVAGEARVFDATVDIGAYEFPDARLAFASQPVNTDGGAGKPAVFSVTSTATNAIFQWQVSLDGGATWADVVESATESGVNTSTLTVTGGADHSGRIYRVRLTSPQPGVVYSNPATFSFVTVGVAAPAGVRNAILAGRTSTISFTVGGDAMAASIIDGAFAVQAMQTGRLSFADGSLKNLAINGGSVSIQTDAPLKAGELVQVTTSGIRRSDGIIAAPLVYQFFAGSEASIAGVFQTGVAIPGASPTATVLACGDVNGDGFVDIVAGGTAGTNVYLNNGSGEFVSTGAALGNGAVSQVLLGSLGFAGSNQLDIVVLKATGELEIWKNAGNATFTSASTLNGLSATSFDLADLNGDGALDLFVATAGADQVWLNNGIGNFSDSGQRLGSGAGVSVIHGDLNLDNSIDVCTANGAGNLELWSNDGTGHFTARLLDPSQPGLTSPADRVIAVDFDKDNRLDLIVVRNTFARIFKDFSGNLYAGLNTNGGMAGGNASALAVGDIDGDRFADIVASGTSGGSLQFWKGQGYFNSRLNFGQVTDQPTLANAKASALADLNGDGIMDAAFITAGGVPTTALYQVAPNAPVSLTAAPASDTQIALAWTDTATGETNYSVERSANGTSGWTVISSTLPANSTSFVDSNRSPATRNYYRVRCERSGVNSPYSGTADALTSSAITVGADSISVLEAGTATALVGGAMSVLANDTNPQAGAFESTVAVAPLRGSLVLNPDGTFSYTPAADYYGTDSFIYRAKNLTTNASTLATVAITVTRLNDAPASLTLTAAPGTQYTGQSAGQTAATLVANDPDPEDLGLLTFSLVSGVGSSGNADFAIIGSTLRTAVVIDAAAGLTRSIRVRVTDSMGLFREESFVVNFTQAPTAAPGTFGTNEDTPVQISLSGTGGAEALVYEIVGHPSHGTLVVGGAANTFTYTPAANYNGTDTFTYRVADANLTSATATVNLNVAPVDDAPTLNAAGPLVTVMDTPLGFTLVAQDPEGDAITYQLTSTPVLGSVQMNGATVTYTPNTGILGTETLQFTATAGGLTSAPRNVIVNITGQPAALTVYRGLYEYTEPGTGQWDGVVPANISTPAHGTVTLDGTRIQYQHNGNTAVSDSFTYTLTNGGGGFLHVAVLVTISDRNVDVTSNGDSGAGTLRAAINLTNRFATETLAPAHTLNPDWVVRILPAAGTFSFLTSSTNEGVALGFYSYLRISGIVTIDASAVPGYVLTTGGSTRARQFLVLPEASLTLKNLSLNNGEAATRTFAGANAAPIPFGGAVLNFGTFTAENSAFRFNRAGEGTAIYNNGGTLSLTNCLFQENYALWASDPGGIVASRNGTTNLSGITFTNNTGQSGGDLSITGNGALATVNVATSTITAFRLATLNSGTLAVTGLPYARPDAVTRPAGQPVDITLATLLANDLGETPVSIAVDALSAQGVTITRNGNTLTYAPPAGPIGADTFAYTVTGASGLTSTATVTVTIATNPFPIGNADAALVYRDLHADIDVLANDIDENGGTLVISAVSTPAHGTATIQGGRIRYVQQGGISTTDSFTYTVSNGTHVTQNVPVTVTIAERVLDATSGADSGPGTLRAALNIVNAFTGANTPQWTIRVLAGSDQTWVAGSAINSGYPIFYSAFEIVGNVLIDASGSPNFTLSGPSVFPNGRLFLVRPGGRLALKDLTLADCQAYLDNPFAVSVGGAVYNQGKFTADQVDFRRNTAMAGAALYNDGGSVTLTDCLFAENVCPAAPDAWDAGIVVSVNGALTLEDVSIAGDGIARALVVWNGSVGYSGAINVASLRTMGNVTFTPAAPTATGDALSHVAGVPLQIPLSTLFANDTNYAGTVFTFSGTSTNGVPIIRAGDALIYNAPPNRVGDDSFTYTLTDRIGNSATATVTIQELDPPPALRIQANGGTVTLTLNGDAFTPYVIEVSDDLVHWSVKVIQEASFENDWVEVREIYTDGGGNATVTDTLRLDTKGLFYRARRW